MTDLLLGAAVGAGSALLASGLYGLYRWGKQAQATTTDFVIRETLPRLTLVQGGK